MMLRRGLGFSSRVIKNMGVRQRWMFLLQKATLALDREATFAVIERIEPLAAYTAKGLRTLLDNFQIGLIHNLLGDNYEQ